MKTSTVQPLSPKEVLRNLEIPGFVITAVNNLLRKHFREGSCTIKQKEIIEEIIKQAEACEPSYHVTSTKIISEKWLDFEPLFKKAGWKIDYDKPGFNETYDATFTFSA